MSALLLATLMMTMAVNARQAAAQSFSSETPGDDGTNFYYQVTYTGTYAHFEVFLDTDNNAATGYTINGIGADYLLEDTNAYKSTANGSGWSWGASIATVTDTAGTGTIKLAVPLSAIGSPASAKIGFQALSSTWVPTVDPTVVTYTKATGTTFSNESATNDATNFIYQANYTGTWAHFEVFLDTDNNAATGYTINGIGADYLLEDTAAYKSTANGSTWSWGTSLGAVTETIGSGTIKMTVPMTLLGSPASAKVAFQVLDASWVPTVDPHVVTFTKSGSAPGAPASLAATAGNAQVALTWAAGSGATSYNVYRGTTAGGESTTAVATGVTSTSYTNTGLTNGTAYFYKVKSVNASGTSAYSNEASATPSAGSVPATPTGLAATAGNTQVALTWTAASGATSYNVYRGTTAGGESTTAVATGVTSTSYTNTGLTNGTTYYYKVKAVNTVGTSGYSNEASAQPHVSAPPAPTGLGASPGNAQVSLSWSASSGATSYNVYRGTSAGGESATAIATGVTSTSYTNTGLTNGTTYYYKVAAVSSGGTSGMSNEASATPAAGTSFYVSPSGNDSNAGTISAPWLTVQHAANVVGPGATVYLRAGTYHQFDVNVSGTAAGGFITFTNYPGEAALVDGTGWTPSFEHGLIHIQNHSYIKIVGLEIANANVNIDNDVPNGVYIRCTTGPMSNVQVVNCHIHNIVIQGAWNGGPRNAHGVSVEGNDGTNGLTYVTVSGCELNGMVTGMSETMTFKGNVQYITCTNNYIHDNNNIGIDFIGGWGASNVAATDMARNATCTGNTVINCSTLHNPAYNVYSSAGLYVDGGSQILLDRNVSANNDIGLQASSERSGWFTTFVTASNNLIYNSNHQGMGMGGYNGTLTGGTQNCHFINNTLYNNDTAQQHYGEFLMAFYQTNNVIENNIMYANAQGLFINYQSTDNSNPGVFDYNVYYSSVPAANSNWAWIGGQAHVGFGQWQSTTGQDAHSVYANPLFVAAGSNFNLGAGSPALNIGNFSLGASYYGSLDFAGSARTRGSTIDIGAYEN